MYNAASNGKLKPRRFYYLIHLPFAHRANGSSSPVRLLMKEQWMLSVKKRMLSVCKQTKRTCPSMAVYGLFAIFLPFSSLLPYVSSSFICSKMTLTNIRRFLIRRFFGQTFSPTPDSYHEGVLTIIAF
jgi:hypothetical protein